MKKRSVFDWGSIPSFQTEEFWRAYEGVEKEVQPIPFIVNKPFEKKCPADKIRLVCISDTHGNNTFLKDKFPKGDILIHAGDFTKEGVFSEVKNFENFLDSLQFPYKIVIAGNHDFIFDPSFRKSIKLSNESVKMAEKAASSLRNHCIYLFDEEIKIYGYKIYGSPYTPWLGPFAFNKTRGKEITKEWKKIPDGTDILITHGPPMGHCDMLMRGSHKGDIDLLREIRERINPLLHIFGHIHEGRGINYNGSTVFINSSIINHYHTPSNMPIVLDIPKRKEREEDDEEEEGKREEKEEEKEREEEKKEEKEEKEEEEGKKEDNRGEERKEEG